MAAQRQRHAKSLMAARQEATDRLAEVESLRQAKWELSHDLERTRQAVRKSKAPKSPLKKYGIYAVSAAELVAILVLVVF